MTRGEFQDAMNELIEAYPKAYPDPVLKRIWIAVHVIDVAELRIAIDRLFDTTNRAPSAAQIRSACRDAINRALEEEKRRYLAAIKGECPWCLNTGMMEAYSRNDIEHTFSMSCDRCQVARIMRFKRITLWDAQRHGRHYVLLNHKDGTFNRWSEQCAELRRKRAPSGKTYNILEGNLAGDILAQIGVADLSHEFKEASYSEWDGPEPEDEE